jgi:hypothetical protein
MVVDTSPMTAKRTLRMGVPNPGPSKQVSRRATILGLTREHAVTIVPPELGAKTGRPEKRFTNHILSDSLARIRLSRLQRRRNPLSPLGAGTSL